MWPKLLSMRRAGNVKVIYGAGALKTTITEMTLATVTPDLMSHLPTPLFCFLSRNRKSPLKTGIKSHGTLSDHNNLQRVEGLPLPDFKSYFKTTIIKTVWSGYRRDTYMEKMSKDP